MCMKHVTYRGKVTTCMLKEFAHTINNIFIKYVIYMVVPHNFNHFKINKLNVLQQSILLSTLFIINNCCEPSESTTNFDLCEDK